MEFNIKTERLSLKPPTISDKNKLFALMSDRHLTTFLTWEPHENIKTTETLIASLIESQDKQKAYHWCIFLNDEIVGLISLIDLKKKIRTWTIDRAEISYLIGRLYQGKGFATEASQAIVNFGFNDLELHKIIIAHATKNIQSKRICEKLGFKNYAEEQDAFKKNKEWHNLLWYYQINNKNEQR